MRQWWSTLTNTGYIVAAIFEPAIVLAVSLALLGFSSFMYHFWLGVDKPRQVFWNYWDILSIFLVFSVKFAILLSFSILGQIGFGLLVTGILGYGHVKHDFFKTFPTIITLFLVNSLLTWWLGMSMWFFPVFALAGAIAHLGFFKSREDLVHGIWHLKTSGGFILWH